MNCLDWLKQNLTPSFSLQYTELEAISEVQLKRLGDKEDFTVIKHVHMLLIGYTGVGKTSVRKHLKNEKLKDAEKLTKVMEPELLVQETIAAATGPFTSQTGVYNSRSDELYLTIWDTGGQPMFQDLLPCFAKLRSIYGIVFQLLPSKIKAYPEHYVRETGDLQGRCIVSPYTNQELIYRSLAYVKIFSQSISTILPDLPSNVQDIFQVNTEEACFPKAMLIGTYRDQFKSESEVNEMESEWLKVFDRSKRKPFSKILWSPTRIPLVQCTDLPVYEIDNTKAGETPEEFSDAGIKLLAEDIIHFTKDVAIQIPNKWLLFKVKLEKACLGDFSSGIMEHEKAVSIAYSCGMSTDDCNSALIYFHELGIFLWYYYSEKNDDKDTFRLRQYVIVLPKQLLKVLAGIFDAVGCGALLDEARETGILQESELRKIIDKQHTGLHSTWVLRFLEEHSLATRFKYPLEGYFIPSFLNQSEDVISIAQPKQPKNNTPAAPLYIVFKVGFIPPALFPMLVVALARDESWNLCTKGSCLYRNRVQFIYMEDSCHVVLSEYCDCIQVVCTPYIGHVSHEICKDIRKTLHLHLFRAVFQWKKAPECGYYFTFECNCKSGVSKTHHFLEEFSLGLGNRPKECTQNGSMRLKDPHLIWLSQDTQMGEMQDMYTFLLVLFGVGILVRTFLILM